MRCTAIYEMHGYAYIWDCLRCTPIYKITLDVRVCEGCTPMCEVHAQCEVHAKPRGREVAAEVASPIQSHFVNMAVFLLLRAADRYTSMLWKHCLFPIVSMDNE
jgi:hypothetical protein